ncbi:hypothetical protein [Halomicrococcus sp. NG-SE-24]|uniref:hypothetical protein n=1 Tax=Halomicrococcus sp. NG-SE-24 TaxID=3436928 RepID=UPI003D9641F3
MVRTHSHRLEKSALVAGFAALAVGVVAAHADPARAYELSIYSATPLAFWAGIGLALVISVGVACASPDWYRSLALVLGGAATLAVTALPVLRGYHFYGAGDSLTHLGWAKDIAGGKMAAYDLLYPGTHSIAIVISETTGLPLRDGLMLMVVAFALLFLVFVPLGVRTVTGDHRATTFAALGGFLLLPINSISVFLLAHPTSQAILFFPLMLFVAAKYITNVDGPSVLPFGTSFGTLLALTSAAIVFVHPQQAVNAALLFGGIVFVQFVYRLFRKGHAIARHRAMYGQTAFLLAVFLLWAPRHERSSGATRALIVRIATDPSTGGDIGQRAASLSQIGGSFEALFLKLFLVTGVFCGLAGILLLVGFFGRFRDADVNAFSKYLAVGLVPLFGLFGVFLATSYSQFHFRVLGFIMVPVTMLGAIAVARTVDVVEARAPNGDPVPLVAGVVVVVLLTLSLLTVFHSPYIYQPSGHVTQGSMTGYGTAFDHRADARFVGLRSPAERYGDGVLGYRKNKRLDFTGTAIYGGFNATGQNFTAGRIARYYDGPRYLPVTDAARQRELRVYDGLRFPARGFRSLEAHPGVSRVQSGGGFQLYYVNGSE